MIALLMSIGLGKRVAQVVAYVAIPLLVLLIVWLLIVSYGNSRYKAGEVDTDAKWQEASDKLAAQVRESGDRADVREADRIEDHATRVEHEKEKLDAAVAEGRSPFDVLFPAG